MALDRVKIQGCYTITSQMDHCVNVIAPVSPRPASSDKVKLFGIRKHSEDIFQDWVKNVSNVTLKSIITHLRIPFDVKEKKKNKRTEINEVKQLDFWVPAEPLRYP